jgi:hypothetical protein
LSTLRAPSSGWSAHRILRAVNSVLKAKTLATSNLSPICSHCGDPVKGNFCGNCGTAVQRTPAADAPAGWSSAVVETIGESQSNSITSVVWQMMRAPVATVIRLAEDPGYRSHWVFLMASLSVYFMTIHIVLPRLIGRFRQETVTTGKWDFVTFQTLTVVAIFIMAPLLYYVFRAVSAQQRRPGAYLKFVTLSLAYWYLLFTALLLTIMAVAVVMTLAVLGLGQATVSDTLTTALQILAFVVFEISAVAVFALMNKRFWQLGWWPIVGITAGYVVVS